MSDRSINKKTDGESPLKPNNKVQNAKSIKD